MSNTIVDMAKLTQMLDNGWEVKLFRSGAGTYTATGWHSNGSVRVRVDARLRQRHAESGAEYFEEFHWTCDEWLVTDDFTPEQALTRLAYKVHGEII